MENNYLPIDTLLERADSLYLFVNLFSDYEQTHRDYGAGEEMTMTAIHILAAVDENPGISGAQLAEKFFCTTSAISQSLTWLEKRGYIIRVVEKGHSKKKMNFSTKLGKKLCNAHRDFDIQSLTKTYNYLLRDCTPDEIVTFYKVLQVYNSIMMAGRKKRMRLRQEELLSAAAEKQPTEETAPSEPD